LKSTSIAIDFDYDRTRVSPSEILFHVKRAMDEYFNRVESDYEEDALSVREIRLYEDVTIVSGRDKS
jgi:hypothetical protein